jgi:hypothetical protein
MFTQVFPMTAIRTSHDWTAFSIWPHEIQPDPHRVDVHKDLLFAEPVG